MQRPHVVTYDLLSGSDAGMHGYADSKLGLLKHSRELSAACFALVTKIEETTTPRISDLALLMGVMRSSLQCAKMRVFKCLNMDLYRVTIYDYVQELISWVPEPSLDCLGHSLMLAFYNIPYGQFAPSVVAAAIFDAFLPAEAKLPSSRLSLPSCCSGFSPRF